MRTKFNEISVLSTAIIAITLIPIGGILGLISSLIIHTISPQYYGLAFNIPQSQGFAIGIGTGLSQGIIAGVALAAALFVAVGLAQKEKPQAFPSPPINNPYEPQK